MQFLRELGDRYAGVERTPPLSFGRRLPVTVASRSIRRQMRSSSRSHVRGRAVEAALEAQHALASTPVRVRIGIHTGEPTIADRRYVGLDVVVAARICAVTHGAQIVVSQATRDLIDKDVATSAITA